MTARCVHPLNAPLARLVCCALFIFLRSMDSVLFFFNDTATTEIYTLSLHDALPIFEKGMEVDEMEFKKRFKKHQEHSRSASAGMFKGGLADAGEQTTKYHTATHLLHQALRQVLGDHVQQKGSNITAERLRFDFSHPDKMTPEQIAEVENIVNEQIRKALPVHSEEMTVEEAKEAGALGFFESKYGEKVKVYSVGSSVAEGGEYFSREICGGPHIKNTSELGQFKIKKEESSSAGVRRIKAVLL